MRRHCGALYVCGLLPARVSRQLRALPVFSGIHRHENQAVRLPRSPRNGCNMQEWGRDSSSRRKLHTLGDRNGRGNVFPPVRRVEGNHRI